MPKHADPTKVSPAALTDFARDAEKAAKSLLLAVETMRRLGVQDVSVVGEESTRKALKTAVNFGKRVTDEVFAAFQAKGQFSIKTASEMAAADPDSAEDDAASTFNPQPTPHGRKRAPQKTPPVQTQVNQDSKRSHG